MSKKQITQLKWGTNLNRILQRENFNGWEALKAMFSILSHQRKANHNYFEMSSYSGYKDKDQ